MTWFRTVQRWYGYGPDAAPVVARPRLIIRVLLWPLLPLTMYQRIELRDGVITSKGKLAHRGPARVGSPVRLERDSGLWGASAPLYRVLTIGSLRILIAYWGGWKRLLDAVDPERRVPRSSVETLADLDDLDND